MRLHISDDEACNYQVYLDGELQELCIFADEEAGVVYCYEVEEISPGFFDLVIDEETGEPQIEVKRGKVELRRVA